MAEQRVSYPDTVVIGDRAELHHACALALGPLGGEAISLPRGAVCGDGATGCVALETHAAAVIAAELVVVAAADQHLVECLAALTQRGELTAAVLAVDEASGEARSLAGAVTSGADDATTLTQLTSPDGPAVIEKALAAGARRRHQQRLLAEMRHAADAAKARADAMVARVNRLEGEAWTDPLTGLANRRQLAARLERMFAEAVRYGAELSCLMIDLDGFKQLNDRMGHKEGDACLRQVAKAIAESVRSSDVPARYGGDEFTVLMPRTPVCEAARVAERLRASFASRVKGWCSCDVQLGISIGVASVESAKPLTGEGLIEAADRAMYASKAGGGDTIMRCETDGQTTVA
jgi:diguanylate cyclase (GGDEF)-like protein